MSSLTCNAFLGPEMGANKLVGLVLGISLCKVTRCLVLISRAAALATRSGVIRDKSPPSPHTFFLATWLSHPDPTGIRKLVKWKIVEGRWGGSHGRAELTYSGIAETTMISRVRFSSLKALHVFNGMFSLDSIKW